MLKSIKEFFFGKSAPKEEVLYKIEVDSKPEPVVVEAVMTQSLVVEPAPVIEPVVSKVEKESKPKKSRAKKPAVEKKEETKSVKTKKVVAKKEPPAAAMKAASPRKTTKSTK